MLWGVQMNRRHKASLICILGLGTFATAAAFVKMSYLPHYGREGDLLWDSRDMTIWTVVEVNIGIICASLIALKPLLLHFCPRLLNDTSVPSHCLRLPEMQTMTDEDATSGFCTNTSSPIMPLAPCLQAARGKDHQPSMTQRAGGSAILPAVLC